MTRQQLDALIGLDYSKAEKIIENEGFNHWVLHEDEIIPDIALLDKCVLLRCNNDGTVVNAETQKSIDAKYEKTN